MKPRVTSGKPERVARARALAERHIITRSRACTSKQRYATKNDARHAAKALSRTSERAVQIYKCPFPACNSGYHLTICRHGEEAA